MHVNRGLPQKGKVTIHWRSRNGNLPTPGTSRAPCLPATQKPQYEEKASASQQKKGMLKLEG